MIFIKRTLSAAFIFICLSQLLSAQTIRDNKPAEEWTDAYPVGNGRLGAMAWGEFPAEKILINEETIWFRSEDKIMPEDSFVHLEAIRELEAKGAYAEADAQFEEHFQGEDPDTYKFLGWLEIEYLTDAKIISTQRRLDLATGISETVFELDGGVEVLQQVWVSAPSDCIVINITSGKALALELKMEGAQVEGNDLIKLGSGGGNHPEPLMFVGRTRVLGSSIGAENSLLVSPSNSHTILVSAATNFDKTRSDQLLPEGWQNKAKTDLDSASALTVETLQFEAILDHQHYFNRLKLDLGSTDPEVAALTTPERLKRIIDGNTDDPDLIETYFQFGRYLLIASSRPGTFPSNLQGIWNPHEWAPWSSDFHLNINIQMNYWLAETANLSELHEPFIDLIRYFQPKGKEMARRMGMKGWVMGHATDIWGNAHMMSTKAYWGGSFFGGQWLTFHILEHYRFTQDPKVLEDNWDILTASTEFVDSWLIPGPEEGQLMARPSASPENSFLYTNASGEETPAAFSAGNSFDQYQILQVFNDYLEAAKVLGKEEDPFVKKITAIEPQVLRPQIGPDGRLMEWRLPFKEKEPGHRHISQVLGAYPGNQINLDKDPALRSAVLKTLESRLSNGGAATGWSRAWIIGMFARLSNPDEAYTNLVEILKRSTADSLLDMHPPFQIDGNFGATAAIAEMLLHSHNDELRLLPALPDAWPTGSVEGIRGRGDYTLGFSWKDHQLTELTLEFGSHSAKEVTLLYNGIAVVIQGSQGSSQPIDITQFMNTEE